MFLLPHRRLLTIAIIVCGMLLAMGSAHYFTEQRSLRLEQQEQQHQVRLYAQALQQRIDRYRTLPQVLALDPELHAALLAPPEPARRDALNRKLERANSVTQSSTLTLIDRDGIAVAASNWRSPASNVGRDYGFRPYVQQALHNGEGRFYGIGLTTGEAGYYLSQAINDGHGNALGLVVIKIELAALEREWLPATDIVLASDAHGVVFLANRDEWRYRTLQPLDAGGRHELRQTRQYGDRQLLPVQLETRRQLGDGARLVHMQQPTFPHPLLWQDAALDEGQWQLHLLHDASAVATSSRAAALAAGAIWLALAFLALFVQQRRRLTAYRLRSREELEAVLSQHAQELRSAQDGLVQAAQQADTGLSRSLEHLAQGVVIIDAQLNLVAWNSRYIELFRFPPELVQVGRPIADLFRHNAQRGLLGPGPIEEAITRRLAHLRSGTPHLRESEKEDGTVLEIRGNPLPDGGFVTSYADITSYKNAARELRSLADALEHRVEERTRDLEIAKREAEDANHYKTRVVASAVHDLLQPLNAARMFISVLRGKLGNSDNLQVVGHVDNALAAQDAILNSLLDISRLESGALQTQVNDFAVQPLLQALAHEFGIIAQARGLQLEHVQCNAIVRSDRVLLRRILQNFLSNAIRYTRRGRILLGCRRSGDKLRIEVHDQGPGIAESLQREIFEEFRRLDDGVAHDRGAGLGLAIVERIGRRLGHRIGLRSQLGSGSVFSVELPLGDAGLVVADTPVTATVEAGDDPRLRGSRVWCVDDDPHVCAATRALLQRWGCTVELADGAETALAMAASGSAPELLLLDMRMGTFDGPQLYEQLCRHWEHAPPVILVSAERGPDMQALAQRHGWGLLAKPVRPPALRALMTQTLLRHRAS